MYDAEAITRVLQYRRDVFVDPGGPHVAPRGHRLHRAEHELAEVHRVHAEIQQRASALREVEVAIGRDDVGRAPTEARLDEQRLADALLAEHVAERAVRREEPRPHRLHDEALLLLCRPHHVVRL